MDCSTPGFPVLHYLLEFAHTQVHWVSDVIQPSHPLSFPSSPALSFLTSGSFPVSRLFAIGGQSIGASASASVLPINVQCWFPLGLTDWFPLRLNSNCPAQGFRGGSEVKPSAWNAGDLGSIPGSGRSPGEGNGKPTPVFLPGESHGGRSLVGYSPWGRKESDTTWVLNNN